MNIREIAKHFYEYITSNHLLDELPAYIAENCVVRMGESVVPVGMEGMRQHMIEVRKT